MSGPRGPYLTAEEAAAYCGCRRPDGSANVRAFYAWARKHGVRRYQRGRRLLFRPADLDAAVDPSHDPLVERALECYRRNPR